ncbi:hypothetical protein A1QO_05475 [Vibrio genomosp. F10 str. ZF-129]|uniref:Uncharacterized protein n=1 Tax=Vibrio genomosp. F10 str. ZF-129 TaxID=1187848 RepID=A0A1E5BGQ6_9VIBR|nr:hypothetical protein [Vibrio genomosp. F10]OEE35719.1 hypothetical protein A1QO_05475 [Vibrio genomosp. F10 str. ZF-129]
MNIAANKTRIFVYSCLIVGLCFYFGKSYLPDMSSIFMPNIIKEETVFIQAPPKEMPVPKLMQEAANEIVNADPKLGKLQSLRKEISIKADILNDANQHGILVEFDNEYHQQSGQQVGAQAVVQVDHLPKHDFGYKADTDAIDVDQGIEIHLPETIPTQLENLKLYMTYKKENMRTVILQSDDGELWNPGENLSFRNMKVRSIGPKEICISESNASRCIPLT